MILGTFRDEAQLEGDMSRAEKIDDRAEGFLYVGSHNMHVPSPRRQTFRLTRRGQDSGCVGPCRRHEVESELGLQQCRHGLSVSVRSTSF